MKANRTTIFLVGVLLLVWGAIGYVIYTSFHEKAITPATLSSFKVKGNTASSDTFSLLLNYSDPFLAVFKVEKKTLDNAIVKTPVKRSLTPVKHVPSEELKLHYMGIMSKGKGGNYSLLIQLNGEDILVNKGDKIEGYTIKLVTEDSLVITKGNLVKIFARQ